MSDTELRKAALNDIEQCVCKDRQAAYGEAESNFSQIAAIWNVSLGRKLTKPINALDVAIMMIGMKLARAAYNPTYRDNLIDVGGYAVCGVALIDKTETKSTIDATPNKG